MNITSLIRGFLFGFVSLMAASVGFAQDSLAGLTPIGKPSPGAMGFQTAATELARDGQWLDGMVLWIITVISIFVTLLLIWVIIRYNSKANKTPARFTHHSMVEIVWTMLPIVILIVIGSFSLPILFKQIEIPESDITIKVTGNQWYWTYEYPESGVVFDSFMIGQGEPGLTEDVKAELASYGYTPDEYLLAADTAIVVPVGATVRVLVTGSDVNHSFAVPAFGIKMDGIVGRLNETWFRVGADPLDVAAGTDSDENYIGTYFGQCSELCGVNHAYMPIVVKAVSQEDYDKWLQGAIAEYASVPAATQVASN
jgi:cytochrome c oxidase subunit 2